MLNKINNCQTPEELHHLGEEIDMSLAPRELKIKMYEAIEAKMKTLNDIMAESANVEIDDTEFYSYGE